MQLFDLRCSASSRPDSVGSGYEPWVFGYLVTDVVMVIMARIARWSIADRLPLVGGASDAYGRFRGLARIITIAGRSRCGPLIGLRMIGWERT